MMTRPYRVQRTSAVRFLLSIVVLAGFASPAAADSLLPSTPPHTVSWYAQNLKARATVELACIDNPGRLANTPDCINAHKASEDVAMREGRWKNGTLDARDINYWSIYPQHRHAVLSLCRNNPQYGHCDVARRSLMIEAGQLQR